MISSSTWPLWAGSDKDGAEAILKDLQVPKDEYRMGASKLFVKGAKTLVRLEELRLQHMPKVAIAIQKIFRSFKCRQAVKKLRLAVTVQKLYRGYVERQNYKYNRAAIQMQRMARGFVTRNYIKRERERLIKERDEARRLHAAKKIQRWGQMRLHVKYVTRMAKTFEKSGLTPEQRYGRDFPFPPAVTREEQNVEGTLMKLRELYWAKQKLLSIPETEHDHMRHKIMGMELLAGRKPWAPNRAWLGDYLDVPTNPTREAYNQCCKAMFQTFHDTHVHFADRVMKVNPYGKVQEVLLIVTDKHIYKYKPGSYKLVKFGIPIEAVSNIKMSPEKDTYIVITCEAPYRDLVVDMGLSGREKYTELAVLLHDHVLDKAGAHKNVTIDIASTFQFNNSRKEGKPGQDIGLVFEKGASAKAPASGCEFVWKKTGSTVLFS